MCSLYLILGKYFVALSLNPLFHTNPQETGGEGERNDSVLLCSVIFRT